MVGHDQGPTDESRDDTAGGGDGNTWEQLSGNTLLEEANALVLYVGRHGNGLFGDDTIRGDDAPLGMLAAAIAKATSSPSAASWSMLMEAYAKVASVTYQKRGVNGRSVLDTAAVRLWSAAYRPLWIGVVLFGIALVVHSVPHLLRPDGFWVTLMGALNPLLIPALWGSVGACTFLAKHLSNRLSEQAYERVRQRGDIVRIFLGAMIGVFAVVVFTDFGAAPGAGGTSAAPAPIAMGPVVIAFATGLAVKPIYAAIETLANSLASRLSRPAGQLRSWSERETPSK